MQLQDQNEAECVKLIRTSLSGDPAVRKPAEEILRANEINPGFCSLLLKIATNSRDYDESTRTLAVIVLKNTIHRSWQAARRNDNKNAEAISSEEKSYLRNQFLSSSLVADQCKPVSVQLKIIVSKIARTDWPQKWSDLFDRMIPYITQTDNILLRRRATHMLYQILKELSTKRLLGGKKNFAEISEKLFPGIKSLWSGHAQAIMESTGYATDTNDNKSFPVASFLEDLTLRVHAELLAKNTKILTLFLVYGQYCKLAESSDISSYFEQAVIVFQRLKLVFQFHSQNKELNTHDSLKSVEYGNDVPVFIISIEKCLKAITKCIVDTQKQRPLEFVPFLSAFLQSIYNNLLNYKVWEREKKWTILSATFVANVIDCSEYRQETGSEVSHGPNSGGRLITAQGDVKINSLSVFSQADDIVRNFFSANVVENFLKFLICKTFVLNETDLEDWNEDAEGFILVQEWLTKEERLRPACEHLLLCLMERFEDIVVPVLVGMLQQHEAYFLPNTLVSRDLMGGLIPASEMGCFICGIGSSCLCFQKFSASSASTLVIPRTVLVRESLYLSMGLVAYHMYNRLSFPDWLKHSLVPLLQPPLNSNESEKIVWSFRILQRRVLWMIRCYVSELTKDLHQALYGALLNLLQMESCDMAVRLSAANALLSLVDDWDFDVDVFVSYQRQAIMSLYSLIGCCETGETRLMLLQIISKIVERVESKAALILPELMKPIPHMWDNSPDASEEGLWKTGILELMSNIVQAVGFENENSVKLLPPIVMPLIGYSTDPSNEGHVYLVDDATKLWSTVMMAVPAYSSPLHELFPRLENIVFDSTCNPKQLNVSLQMIEAYVLLGRETLLNNDVHVNTLRNIFNSIIGNVKPRGEVYAIRTLEVCLTTFPQRGPGIFKDVLLRILDSVCLSEENDSALTSVVLIGYLTILARVCFNDQSFYMALIRQYAGSKETQTSLGGAFFKVVKLWITKFQEVGNSSAAGPWRRKLWAIVLSVSLTMEHEELLRTSVASILSICIHAFEEVGGDKGTSLARERYDLPPEGNSTNYFSHKRKLFLSDPVVTTDIRSVLNESLYRCEHSIGSANFEALVVNDSAAYETIVRDMGLPSRPCPPNQFR